MLRRLSLLLALFSGSSALHAEAPAQVSPRPIASAMHAAQAGRWERAAQLARRDGPAAEALIEWQRLRTGRGTPAEVLDFLAAYPDWPGLDRLRRESEPAFAEATDAQILAFFKDARPQTGIGALAHARAQMAVGQRGEAEAGIVLAWRTLDLDIEEHTAFLNAHGPLLEPHHAARLDMTLWRGWKDSVPMMPLVTEDQRKIAEIRQMLEDGQSGVDAALAKLPEALRDTPGIAYGRFNRYLKRDEPEEAMALMLSQSRIAEGLGEPERWASWRRALARRMLRDGDPQMAYELAANHQLVEGASYADLEWLSGYVALRFMNEPALAMDHFQRLRAGVVTPISLGRAGYWIGRAQEAMGDEEGAAIAYEQGAEHQTTFYGLLAAQRAGVPPDPALAGTEVFPPWREAPFAQGLLNQAAILALAADQRHLAEMLFMALADSQDRTGLGQVGAMLEELGQPHLQVMLGKQAAQRGIVLPRYYYALHPMAEMKLPVPMAMALSIARRESEFDHLVVSGAGAEGLMQVMPGTAGDVARDLGLEHDRTRVRLDWAYNAQLGSEYLAQLSERFAANVVMMAAGYNAGPSRPESWIRDFGDPRTGEIDVVDWIETIPFRETRNYVQRVAESLPVYRARLGLDPHPVPFSQELIGATVPALRDRID